MAGSPFGDDADPFDSVVEPSGRFVYLADGTAGVAAFVIDPATGALAPIQGSPFAAQNVYVVNNASGDISAFAVDPTDGALTPVAGSPFPAEGTALRIATVGALQ